MTTTTATLQSVLDRIDADFDGALDRLCRLLRIPSISTDPEYATHIRQAAESLAVDLKSIGFDASVRDTTGHPLVVAHHPGPPGEKVPHILYYGHYDVQPPDPLEEWDSGPFDPAIVPSEHGRKIVARGAVDDKGQLMTFIEAFRAWHDVHGTMPIRITVMLEGEEESGSPSLDAFLQANRDELRADACIVCDTGMWQVDVPAITYMLRGLVYIEATLHGPGMDLHSGGYGGAVVNPINAITRVLAQLHDDRGVVQIPGFYDDVRELSDAEAAQWKALGFDERAFLASAGLKTPTGEAGRSTLERIWSRPTCDINGIRGGYIGDGAKTVIGNRATAKISCRLVADQDPKQVQTALVRFLEDRRPPDCRWTFHYHGCNPAIRVPTDSPYLAAASRGLATVFERPPVLIGSGGSIPVVGSIQKILGFDSLLVGFGLDDDRIHSPNEKFEVACYQNGIRSHAAIMDELSRLSV
ncbi:MAG: M20/M25/M40 family metallo-hydrolase [Phycisphaerales bacterium]|nr:M20/M25/M40 family metallo-hydrolase [Phycisphaerales bacterium]